jgi:hypothetical protein
MLAPAGVPDEDGRAADLTQVRARRGDVTPFAPHRSAVKRRRLSRPDGGRFCWTWRCVRFRPLRGDWRPPPRYEWREQVIPTRAWPRGQWTQPRANDGQRTPRLRCARIWSEFPAGTRSQPRRPRQQGPGGKSRTNPRASAVIPFRASCLAYAELMLRAARCEGGASRWPALTVFRGPASPRRGRDYVRL